MKRLPYPQKNRRVLRRSVRVRIPIEHEYCDVCMEAFQAQVDNERPGHVWAVDNGKVIYLEDMIAENNLGRRLTENEVVIHRDKNPLNNTWKNLEVVNLDGLL